MSLQCFNPSPATHRLVTTESGDPVINEQRILLQRLSDDQLEYCELTEGIINSFNLMLVNDADKAAGNSLENKGTPEGLKWTPEQTLLLIRLVESNYEKFNEGLKKNVWQKIANQLSSITNKVFTVEQCDTKWKGLKRTYKCIKDHNKTSGNDRKKWEYFSAIDGFLGQKPEITPRSVCSTSTNELEVRASVTDASSSSETSATPTRKRKRSGGLEERHREKMEIYDKFLKLFKIAVEHQTGQNISYDRLMVKELL